MQQVRSSASLSASELEKAQQESLDLLIARSDALTKEIERLELRKQELPLIEKQIEVLNKINEEFSCKKIEIEKNLSEKKSQLNELDSTSKNLFEEKTELEKSILELKEQNKKLQSEINESTFTLRGIKSDISIMEEKKKAFILEYDTAEVKSLNMKNLNKDLNAEFDILTEKRKLIGYADFDLRALKEKIENAKSVLANVDSQVQATQQSASTIISDAEKKAEQKVNEQMKVLLDREQQLNVREGEISRKESFLTEKTEQLKLVKAELEIFYNRTISHIIF